MIYESANFYRLLYSTNLSQNIPSFVNYCPSNLLSGSSPPSPLPKAKVQIIQTVCGWKGVGGGFELCWRL
jgi:hypothetical protein